MSWLNDLVESKNGKVSQSKLWANIGSAVATWVVIYLTVHEQMTAEILAMYLLTVAGFAQLSKFLAYKFGGNQYVDPVADRRLASIAEMGAVCPAAVGGPAADNKRCPCCGAQNNGSIEEQGD